VHALYPAYASHAPQFAPRRERIWLYSRIEKSLRLDLAGLRIRRRRAEALELPNHSRGALRLGLSGDGWGFATNSVVVGDGSDGLIVSQARDHATIYALRSICSAGMTQEWNSVKDWIRVAGAAVRTRHRVQGEIALPPLKVQQRLRKKNDVCGSLAGSGRVIFLETFAAQSSMPFAVVAGDQYAAFHDFIAEMHCGWRNWESGAPHTDLPGFSNVNWA
jgi:hypothetical protein